ncbi:DNA-directed DNA polymerase epsilon, subunit B [Scheffersomyces xylosifermentans]|uniref:DNA-directed DNA polymerase epsilon, subunit B n=1 Tax=Scheffersomyces xylosifermentans TaxID=1304137 RepID=UPI00315C9397
MEGANTLPIKLQPSNLRPIAYRIFSKKHGLNIKTDALALLTEVVGYKFSFEWKGAKSQQFLEEVAKIWKIEDRGLFIDGPGLKQVLKELNTKSVASASAHRSHSTESGEITDKATRMDTLIDVEEEEEAINWEEYFKVINPSEQPPCTFDRHRKQFKLQADSKKHKNLLESLPNNLQNTIELFNNRYYLLFDRLSRNENFQKASFSSISSINKSLTSGNIANEITLIKNVLGRDGSKFILFGLLGKDAKDSYILEDCTDYIELNLSQTYKTEGSFYCPGMFVIVEGIYSASGRSSNQSNNYIGGCFHVSNIGHPPAERRDVSSENYGNLDFLGIHKQIGNTAVNEKVLKINKTLRRKLTSLEKTLLHHKFILLGSECYLDDFKILDGLKKFFHKLENDIIESQESEEKNTPLAIVMTGSFSCRALTTTNSLVSNISNSENYKSHFDNLANILSNYPNVTSTCKFILMPGKNDPWQSSYALGGSAMNYFPQKPVPRVFVSRLERLLPKGNLILGWNPVRINYLSQEILILKDDLMNKFKRNDIIFSNDLEAEKENLKRELSQDNKERINSIVRDGGGGEHIPTKIKQARKLVKTVLDQGTLQPFLKDLKLVNAEYDYVLRIEPLPSVMIFNDVNFDNFEVTYNGCKVVNVTRLLSPSNRKLNYVEYYPSNKRFEFKELYF